MKAGSINIYIEIMLDPLKEKQLLEKFQEKDLQEKALFQLYIKESF